jgi:hypothetical protein
MRDLVVQFWTNQNTISPNQKDVVKHYIGVKLYEEHVAHYLRVSQVNSMTIGTFLIHST